MQIEQLAAFAAKMLGYLYLGMQRQTPQIWYVLQSKLDEPFYYKGKILFTTIRQRFFLLNKCLYQLPRFGKLCSLGMLDGLGTLIFGMSFGHKISWLFLTILFLSILRFFTNELTNFVINIRLSSKDMREGHFSERKQYLI